MQSIAQTRADGRFGNLLGGTLPGAGLVAAGLSLAYVTIGTPLVSRLVVTGREGSSQVTTAMLVSSFAIIAGVALLVSGTNRLAITIASVRSGPARRSPVMRAIGERPDDIEMVSGVAPGDGGPIPELLIGPFGVAVVHELGGLDRIRRVDGAWEARTRDGWEPTEDPLDRAARDADRLRRRLISGDLDFVVRVHAALVTADTSIARSPLCAVITPDQIPAWIAALPRQRSLSAGRRQSLLARVREAVVDEGQRGGW